ncbi:MAG: hypothetical protein J6X60_13880 [Ruminiclostridium sp.]|nr:hypothetical protein [Ruminiclostridium sp.]
MEIITSYIDTMFADVPKNEQTERLREDITANMSDKYDELIKEGKSINEAIGTVIAEFGNIDEVLSEMGISRTAPQTEAPEDYPGKKCVKRINSCSVLLGTGVFAVLIGAVFIAVSAVFDLRMTEGSIGLCSAITCMLTLMAAVIIRERIVTDNTAKEAVPVLRKKYDEMLRRGRRSDLICCIAELIGVIIIAPVLMTGTVGGFGTLLLMFLIEGLSAGIRTNRIASFRIVSQLLGEPVEALTGEKIINMFTPTFLAGSLCFLGQNYYRYGGNSLLMACVSVIIIFLAVFLLCRFYDITKDMVLGKSEKTKEISPLNK